VVIGAVALLVLTNLCGLSPEDAVASVVRTATTLPQAAMTSLPTPATRARRDRHAPAVRAH